MISLHQGDSVPDDVPRPLPQSALTAEDCFARRSSFGTFPQMSVRSDHLGCFKQLSEESISDLGQRPVPHSARPVDQSHPMRRRAAPALGRRVGAQRFRTGHLRPTCPAAGSPPGYSLHDAFFLVRSHRSIITPNIGFMEKLGLRAEPQRAPVKKQPISVHRRHRTDTETVALSLSVSFL